VVENEVLSARWADLGGFGRASKAGMGNMGPFDQLAKIVDYGQKTHYKDDFLIDTPYLNLCSFVC
jgi:hypothetical protein